MESNSKNREKMNLPSVKSKQHCFLFNHHLADKKRSNFNNIYNVEDFSVEDWKHAWISPSIDIY